MPATKTLVPLVAKRVYWSVAGAGSAVVVAAWEYWSNRRESHAGPHRCRAARRPRRPRRPARATLSGLLCGSGRRPAIGSSHRNVVDPCPLPLCNDGRRATHQRRTKVRANSISTAIVSNFSGLSIKKAHGRISGHGLRQRVTGSYAAALQGSSTEASIPGIGNGFSTHTSPPRNGAR